MLRKKIVLALLVTSVLLNAIPSKAAFGGGRHIEGTWTVKVTITAPGFPESFTALETYSRGGGLVTSNNLPFVPRAGQGTWDKFGGQFIVAIRFFSFDENGAPNGSIKVSHTITLESEDEYSGTGTAEFFNLNGDKLGGADFQSKGRRIIAEP